MKTFKFIVVVLSAITLCTKFSSCNNDEPAKGDNGLVLNEKRLVKIVNEWDERLYEYDNQGRLIKDKHGDYFWTDDAIKYFFNNYSEYFYLENSLITNTKYKTFTYNQSNRLSKIINSKDDFTINFLWDNDKLISINEEYDNNYVNDNDITITYDKICKKGYFPIFYFLYFGDHFGYCEDFFTAQPEILGVRTKQLPAIVHGGRYNEHTRTLAYEFDKEGYISKIIINKVDYDGESYTSTYILTWK